MELYLKHALQLRFHSWNILQAEIKMVKVLHQEKLCFRYNLKKEKKAFLQSKALEVIVVFSLTPLGGDSYSISL